MKRPKINEKEAGGVPFKKPSSCLHQCLFLHIITDLVPKYVVMICLETRTC